MNKDLVTYQTYESPKKTGGVIVGVSLLTVGLAILILYLVDKSRQAEGWGCTFPDASNYDPVATKDDGKCKFDNKSKAWSTTVGGLLDELSTFGSPSVSANSLISEELIQEMRERQEEQYGMSVEDLMDIERDKILLAEKKARQDRDAKIMDDFFADAQAEQDRRDKEEYEIINLPYYQIP